MSDIPEPESMSPAETGNPTTAANIGGGVNLDAQHDVNIDGDVVGRDKIVSTTYGYTVEQVGTLLTQISTTFQPKPFDGRCPYVGLAAFSEDDADRFFGRETLVGELVARVKDSRFVVIAGPSGSGKSSLVRAGLIHTLKQGALPNSDRWLYTALKPERDPIESLALAISRLAKSPEAGDYIRGHQCEVDALHKLAESLLSDRLDQRAVIFVDQFEEVFTQGSKEEERVAFLNLLTQAPTIENGRVTVLFALRSDFVSNCAAYPQLNMLLNQQFLQVGAMQPDELVSAIARPALQVGLRIDPDLVAQIVNDMQDEPGALPLMQFALKDVFDAQQAQGGVVALTLKDYLARGGLHKALERHADAVFARLSENEQQLARTIFSGLIEVGRGTQDTRRTAVFDELVPANVDTTRVKAVVQKLAEARLITTDEQGDKDTVTISHERLIGAWPWLHRLVNENREAIALQNRIAEDAQEWGAGGRDASYLYTGARLANAREQLAAQKIVLSGLAQAFVTASVEADEAERQLEEARRQKELDDARRLAESEKQRAEEQARSAGRLRQLATYLIGALGIALVLGVLTGVFGVQSSQNADMANRNAATAEAASTLAVANARTAQAASTQAVTEANVRATAQSNALAQRDEAQRQAAIADSRRLAALALNHLDIELTDLDYPVRSLALQLARTAVERAHTDEAESALRQALRLSQQYFTLGEYGASSGSLRELQFSPDGQRVAVVQAEAARNVWLFDIATTKLMSRITLSENVTSLIFAPDGQSIATIEDDGVLRVWDIGAFQARERYNWAGAGAGVTSAVYAPDGQRLLTINGDLVVRLLNAADGRVATVGPSFDSFIFQALFSADGKKILTMAGGRDVRLWEAATGKVLANIVGPASPGNKAADVTDVLTVYLSPDGEQVLFVTYPGVLWRWTASTQQATVVQDFGLELMTAVFSRDGLRLAMLDTGQSLALYAIDTGQLVVQTRLSEPTTRLALSPDSQRLITFGINVLLWDARDGRNLVEVEQGHASRSSSALMVSAIFSPDGQAIALYGEGYDHPMMRFEPVYIAGLLEWARRLAPGDLTCEQQAQYQIVSTACSTPTPVPTPKIVSPP